MTETPAHIHCDHKECRVLAQQHGYQLLWCTGCGCVARSDGGLLRAPLASAKFPLDEAGMLLHDAAKRIIDTTCEEKVCETVDISQSAPAELPAVTKKPSPDEYRRRNRR